MLLVQPGKVEHLLGGLVIAKLAVGEDAVAVAGLEAWVDNLNLLEGEQRVLKPPRRVLIQAQPVERLDVVRIDEQSLLVGLDRLIGSAQLVEGKSDIEEPGGVIGMLVAARSSSRASCHLRCSNSSCARSTRRSASLQSFVSIRDRLVVCGQLKFTPSTAA
jgi:hypothetical protein